MSYWDCSGGDVKICSGGKGDILEGKFSPYVDNGGSAAGIGGKGFVCIAADTRMSSGYSISTRTCTKMTKLTDDVIISSCGMQADVQELHRQLLFKIEWYRHQNNGKFPSVSAIAQLLSTMLYYKRFFPFYAFNLLAGLDSKGNGIVCGYDAIGSFEQGTHGAQGSGQQLILPFLDNQIGRSDNSNPSRHPDISHTFAEDILKDAFFSAGERDIFTGDFLEIFTITKDGISSQSLQLNFD